MGSYESHLISESSGSSVDHVSNEGGASLHASFLFVATEPHLNRDGIVSLLVFLFENIDWKMSEILSNLSFWSLNSNLSLLDLESD